MYMARGKITGGPKSADEISEQQTIDLGLFSEERELSKQIAQLRAVVNAQMVSLKELGTIITRDPEGSNLSSTALVTSNNAGKSSLTSGTALLLPKHVV